MTLPKTISCIYKFWTKFQIMPVAPKGRVTPAHLRHRSVHNVISNLNRPLRGHRRSKKLRCKPCTDSQTHYPNPNTTYKYKENFTFISDAILLISFLLRL
ncbi:hypothetical protein ACSQ67_022559 [Phaseolus vulgaris]